APHRLSLLRSRTLFLSDAPTATETPTLSLHDALPISPPTIARSARTSPTRRCSGGRGAPAAPVSGSSQYGVVETWDMSTLTGAADRKSTRLNSSHVKISYAVFCLKKKKHGIVSQMLVR